MTRDEMRQQIITAIQHWQAANAVVCEHSQIIDYGEAADAVLIAPAQPDVSVGEPGQWRGGGCDCGDEEWPCPTLLAPGVNPDHGRQGGAR